MEFGQLEYFCKLAHQQHMTQTADELNISQPALSKSITRLENDLGIQLFDREGRNIRLNSYGEIVLRYAEQILCTIGDMQAELDAMSEGKLGHIRLGSSFSAGKPNWLLDGIRSYLLSRPDVSFSLRQHNLSMLKSALENREIDLAVTTLPMCDPNICWQELFQEPMGVILSKYHSLTEKPIISMSDLRGERFYCNNANSDLMELNLLFCRNAGFEPNIHFECDFPSLIGEAISMGHGVSIISERGYLSSTNGNEGFATQEWEENILYRPLKEPYCRRICGVAYLSGRRLPPPIWDFYEHLIKTSLEQ